jgi:hypothetical protein
MTPHSFPTARLGALFVAALLGVVPKAHGQGALPRGEAERPPASPASHESHARPADSEPSLTPVAREQLAAVRKATERLDTPAAARAANYRPVFGQVPLQGEHYVRTDLVASGTFDLAHPPVLIYSPVRGKPTLVGVAYAYMRPVSAPIPAGFDGTADEWHSHQGLAWVAGTQIVMTHAWFVGAPDGPFARYNPWLPYLAAGLAPPKSARRAASDSAARRLGLAIALALTPPMLFERLEERGGPAVADRAAELRREMTALLRDAAAAQRRGDRTAYARLTRQLVRHGDALVAHYRDAAAARPLVQRLVDRTVDEFMGRGHGVEEELERVLRGDAAPDEHHAGHPGRHR